MAELYLFTDGTQNIGFSPHLFSETWEGTLYTATAVSRSSLNLSGNLAKSQITFTFPNTTEFAKRRVFDLPGEGWDVRIYEDKVLLWSGRVIGATLAGTKINIVTDSGEKASSRNPTGARFALHCWKNLYSTTCGAIKENFLTTLAVTVSGTTVTLPGVQDLNKFAGGVMEKAGESRRIIRNSGTTLEISTPFVSSASGSADLYPGCALTSVDCTKFNNLVNFGGFEYIPILNPTERSGLL
jgi:hypothetical protein